MSIENGAGLTRSNRTRVPLAVAVNCSAPLPPLTSTVSTPSPPSFRSVSSPGFQIIRSLPPWPKAWSSASPPVRVSFSPPPNRRSLPPLPRSVSLPPWPKSWSAPEPPVRTSLPAPPNRFAFGSAPFASLRLITSLSPRPKTRISVVLATVGVPPTTATAPPLTRILPAALRLIAMVLAALSPDTVSTPLLNVAVVAAFAGLVVAPNTAAASATPVSRRSAVRRQLLVRPAVIVPPLESNRPRCANGGLLRALSGLGSMDSVGAAVFPTRPVPWLTTARRASLGARCGLVVSQGVKPHARGSSREDR